MSTSRLKKHVAEGRGDGVAENFCLIGTPLPSLDAKRDANEFKPAWRQEAYDEQGRRRFHGAFTGGWSAGYYNTVGSREGWTPSAYRSSRKDKGVPRSAVCQSVEDFMDEEDKEDIRQQRGSLQHSDVRSAHPDPLLGALGGEKPDSNAYATSSTIELNESEAGTNILRQMGWTPGQGIGPDLLPASRRQRQALLGLVVDTLAEDAEAQLVPPPDTPVIHPVELDKGARRGLGWQSDQSEKPQSLAALLTKQRGHTNGGKTAQGGFGIGALEYDSDGEEDVYALGQDAKHNSIPSMQSKSLPMPAAKYDEHDVLRSNENVWHDGSAMIAGFILATREQKADAWYAAPAIPVGWHPDPSRVWNMNNVQALQAQGVEGSDKDSIPSEKRAPGPPPLLSDYLTMKDRERLDRDGSANAPLLPQTAAPSPSEVSQNLTKLDAETAKAALRGYMPFANDTAKQARYRNFLESVANRGEQQVWQPTLGIDRNTFHQEVREFSRSAEIFKPMNVVMSNRFQSARLDVTESSKPAGLHLPEGKNGSAAQASSLDDDVTLGQSKAQTDTQKSRRVQIWRPSRLLCKRFGVELPYKEDANDDAAHDVEHTELQSRVANVPTSKSNINARWEDSKRQLQRLAADRAWEQGTQANVKPLMSVEALTDDVHQSQQATPTEWEFDISQIGLGDALKDNSDMDVSQKPSIEVFQAVFGDSEEESGKVYDRGHEKQASPLAATDSAKHTASADPHAQRLAFIPRKRQQVSSQTTSIDAQRKVPRKKSRSAKGLLTFNFDEEDG